MTSELNVIWQHSRIYGLGRLIDRLAALLLIPILVHALTPEQWGIYALILVVTEMLTVVPMGIFYTMVRIYFDHDDDDHRRRIVATTLALLLMSSTVLVALAWPFAWAACQVVFGNQDHRGLFVTANFGVVFVLLFEIGLDYFRLKKRSGLFICATLTRSLLQFSVSIFLVVVWNMGVLGVVLGHLVAVAAVSLPVGAFMALANGVRLNRPLVADMIKLGLPLSPTGLARSLLQLVERYLINLFAGTAVLGIFALATRLADQLRLLLSGPFSDIWEVRLMEIADQPEKAREFNRVLVYFLCVLAAAVLALSVYAPEIIMLVSDRSFWSAADVVPVLAFAVLIRLVNYHFQVCIIQRKQTWYLVIVSWSVIVVGAAALLVLVPAFGLIGAAWAVLLTQACRLALSVTFAARCSTYVALFPWRSCATILAFTLAAYLAAHFAIGSGVSVSGILLKAALLGLFGLAIYVGPVFTAQERRLISTGIKTRLAKLLGSREAI